MGWSDAPPIVKVYFISSHVALLLQILGMATPLWVNVPEQEVTLTVQIKHLDAEYSGTVKIDKFGLWQACGSSGCYETSFGALPAWYGATRVFETIGLIGSLVLSIAVLMFMFLKSFREVSRAQIIMMIISFATGAVILLGVIIWGATVKYNLNFSFAMCCMSSILYVGIGIMLFISSRSS